MAFNFNKKRTLQIDSIDEKKETTNGVIATQGWVSNVLNRVWAWTLWFRTTNLTVNHAMNCNKIFSNGISSDKVVAREITLIGRDGKPYNLFVDESGELKAKYDFERVYVYPGNDVEIKEFKYDPTYPKVSDNFRGFTPHQIMSRFFKFVDEEFVIEDGIRCPMLCPADGNGIVVPHTLLITCNETKMITAVKICDEDFNLVKRLPLPEGKATRKLTINMPMISGSTGWEIVELPDIMIPIEIQPHGNPQDYFLPSNPLDPRIFDDVPPDQKNDIFSERTVKTKSTRDLNEDIFSEDVQVWTPDETQDILHQDYHTENYSNIVLSNSSFDKNKKQFLMFDVEKV